MAEPTASKPTPTPFRVPKDVECWGHRGASAFLPENTWVVVATAAAMARAASGLDPSLLCHACALPPPMLTPQPRELPGRDQGGRRWHRVR